MSLKLLNELNGRLGIFNALQPPQKTKEKFASESEKMNNEQAEIEICNAEINCILNISSQEKRKEHESYKFN